MMSYFWHISTSRGSAEFLSLLTLTAAKATLLLACAAAFCLAFRRLSAATRHLLWASALCASLLLPFLSFIKMWELPILPARMLAAGSSGAKESPQKDEAFEMPEARASRDFSTSLNPSAGMPEASVLQTNAESFAERAPAPHAVEPQSASPQATTSIWPQLVNGAIAVWVSGVLLFLLKLLSGFIATNLLVRRAVEFKDPALTALFSTLLREVNLKSTARLLRSERTSMPIVCGILRPAVLLPAEAETWSEERQRMVLLHELTHITRRDCLTQMMAQMACALYWFNPFIWFAARRLRVEREQACDDYVLSIGAKPSDYAHHLLEIARSMQERSIFEWTQTTSVAMARRSQLEGRLLAILSKENKRGAVSRAAAMSLVVLICVLFLSLAVIRPTVIHAQGPQTSNGVSSDEKENTERALQGSLAASVADRGSDALIHGAQSHEAGRNQEDAAATVDISQNSNDEKIENKVERNLNGGVEHIVEQEAAEIVEQQSTTILQAPEVNPTIKLETNPFINAAHRQERMARTQDKPGDFIDEMASAGLTNLSVDELIRLKTAGVTADYVRSLRALGFANLTSKEIASLSIHGITPAYVQTIRAAGYNDLSAKELSTFRIHGITPEYIKTLRDAGYGNLSAKQLIEFAVHRVTPAFIGAMRAAGYGNLSPRELVSLRVHDVTPEFIRKARSRLGDMTLKQLLSLKMMGILEDEKGKDKDKEKE
jgi:beta-lactamase regulating signal transducer with metallopeptidase domain